MKADMTDEIPHLRAYARSLCKDDVRADDLVQTTCLKALSNIQRFKPGTNLRAWLFTIMRNSFLSEIRKARPEAAMPEDADSFIAGPPANQEASVEFDDMVRALHTLQPEFREALILVGAAGLSYEEAASVMDVRVGTVKSRVCRARAALQEALDSGKPLPPSHEALVTFEQLVAAAHEAARKVIGPIEASLRGRSRAQEYETAKAA